MGYQITGTLYIPGMDYYEFIEKLGKSTGWYRKNDEFIFGVPYWDRKEKTANLPIVSPADAPSLEIGMETFWEFVNPYAPINNNIDAEIIYGVPRWNKTSHEIEIDFAADSDGDPVNWANSPKCLKQWSE